MDNQEDYKALKSKGFTLSEALNRPISQEHWSHKELLKPGFLHLLLQVYTVRSFSSRYDPDCKKRFLL